MRDQPRVTDQNQIASLNKCWAVLRAPAGKRLAPMLPGLVPLLRRDGKLDLTEQEADSQSLSPECNSARSPCPTAHLRLLELDHCKIRLTGPTSPRPITLRRDVRSRDPWFRPAVWWLAFRARGW